MSEDVARQPSSLVEEVVDKFRFLEENERVIAAGGRPATAARSCSGFTKASLSTESFILGGVLPGDHAGPHGGVESRAGRLPARPQGKRHDGPPHPRVHRSSFIQERPDPGRRAPPPPPRVGGGPRPRAASPLESTSWSARKRCATRARRRVCKLPSGGRPVRRGLGRSTCFISSRSRFTPEASSQLDGLVQPLAAARRHPSAIE